MLISKIITPPDDLDELKETMQVIADMVIAYWEELSSSEFIFDVAGFLKEWREGTRHVLFYCNDGEPVGFAFARSGSLIFSSGTMMVIENIYIKPEFRGNSEAIEISIRQAKDYAKGKFDEVLILTDPNYVPFLQKKSGAVIKYVGMQV